MFFFKKQWYNLHDMIQWVMQCRRNTWTRWVVTRGTHEHRRPILIYICCDKRYYIMLYTSPWSIRLGLSWGDEGITPPQAFHRSCNGICSIIKSKFNTDREQLTKWINIHSSLQIIELIYIGFFVGDPIIKNGRVIFH
jgi:hypothetical protein